MNQQYLFSCVDQDRSVQYGFKVDDDVGHYYVVREFLQFLSSIYGYDLTEKYLDHSSDNT
jgi:hypothetical protein